VAGIITRIREVLNSELPTENSLYTRILGLAIPIDPFLTGESRFSRKIGDFTSLIMADTATSIASGGSINSERIVTNEICKWVVVGSRLLIQNSELMTVRDFNVDVAKNQMTIDFEEKLRTDHPDGSSVLLYGHPVKVDAVQPSALTQVFNSTLVDGTGTITGVVGRRYVVLPSTPLTVIVATDVASNVNLPWTNPLGTAVVAFPTVPLAGVKITYQIQQTLAISSTVKIYPHDELTMRFGGFEIAVASLANQQNGVYLYNITMAGNVKFPPPAPAGKSVKDGYGPVAGDTIYLRCWPCYESKPCAIPSLPQGDTNLGPVAFDWLSGVTAEETSYEEFMTITTQDAAQNPVWTKEVQKNHVLLQEPIRSDAMLFWDLLRGHLNWNGQETLAKPDALGIPEFQAHYKCAPPFRGEGQIQTWRLRFVNPNVTAVQVVITLEPTAPQTFTVPAGATQFLKIQVPQNQDITRVYVCFHSVVPDPNNPSQWIPGGTLTEWCRFGNWAIDGSVIQFVTYRMLAKVNSRFKWASTGACIKPLFLNMEYLRTQLDMSAFPDNGKVFF